MVPTSLAEAEALDRADPLASFRGRFRLPEGVIYLDGNSLGALPAATPERIAAVVEGEWGNGLIASWNAAGWIDAPARVGAKIARLIGAGDDEVIVADSTSANLFKLLVAAGRLDDRPGHVLSEPGNFPTDLHVAEGALALLPHLTMRLLPAEEIAASIDADTRIVLLTHVHYKSGRRHDMAAISRAARAAGAPIVWDLSHSTGAVPVDLGGCGADMAVGCGYKYLNGGPGAPAYLYVRRGLQERLRSPLSGWMGHAAPFAFEDGYRPGEGISRFLCGTPPVLGLAGLEVGVDLLLEADREALFAKSAALFDLFVARVTAECPTLTLVTPERQDARGSHVSFVHPEGHAIVQALIARGVIGDFRAPDIVRFGLTPLYTSYADIWWAADAVRAVMTGQEWRDARFAVRHRVT